jgi:putative membrane protein
MISHPKRLHPASALIKFLKSLRELALPLLIFFFVGGGKNDNGFDYIYTLGIVVFIVLFLLQGIINWYRFTYRVEDGELRIEHGILVRKKRYIPLERIQTIDISAGVIERLFGLVKIQVETAGGGKDAEAILSAVTIKDAEFLRDMLQRERHAESQEELLPSESFMLLPKQLLIMASTSGGVGVVLSAMIAFLTQFDELLPYEYLHEVTEVFVKSGIVMVALGIFFMVLFSWLISIIMTTIKYGKFTVVNKGNELLITRGILEKRELTIPLKRIQAVRIQENIVRQLFGLASVFVEVAGGTQEKKEEFSTLLFPIIRKKDLQQNLKIFTPEYVIEEDTFLSLPLRARKRFIIRAVAPIVPLIIFLSWWSYPWGLVSLISIPLAMLLGEVMYRESGYHVIEDRLKLRYRFINRHMVLAKKNRIQAFQIERSYFQREQQLASIVISVQSKLNGKHFKLQDLDNEDANQLLDWYSYEKGCVKEQC